MTDEDEYFPPPPELRELVPALDALAALMVGGDPWRHARRAARSATTGDADASRCWPASPAEGVAAESYGTPASSSASSKQYWSSHPDLRRRVRDLAARRTRPALRLGRLDRITDDDRDPVRTAGSVLPDAQDLLAAADPDRDDRDAERGAR